MKQIFLNIWRVTQRELGRMMLRPLYLFASIGVMGLCTFFFLSIMKRGAPERMPVAVVDKDQSSISRRLCHETNATQSVEIVLVTPNFADARLAMQQGEVFGILEIPDGFYADIASFKQPT